MAGPSAPRHLPWHIWDLNLGLPRSYFNSLSTTSSDLSILCTKIEELQRTLMETTSLSHPCNGFANQKCSHPLPCTLSLAMERRTTRPFQGSQYCGRENWWVCRGTHTAPIQTGVPIQPLSLFLTFWKDLILDLQRLI